MKFQFNKLLFCFVLLFSSQLFAEETECTVEAKRLDVEISRLETLAVKPCAQATTLLQKINIGLIEEVKEKLAVLVKEYQVGEQVLTKLRDKFEPIRKRIAELNQTAIKDELVITADIIAQIGVAKGADAAGSKDQRVGAKVVAEKNPDVAKKTVDLFGYPEAALISRGDPKSSKLKLQRALMKTELQKWLSLQQQFRTTTINLAKKIDGKISQGLTEISDIRQRHEQAKTELRELYFSGSAIQCLGALPETPEEAVSVVVSANPGSKAEREANALLAAINNLPSPEQQRQNFLDQLVNRQASVDDIPGINSFPFARNFQVFFPLFSQKQPPPLPQSVRFKIDKETLQDAAIFQESAAYRNLFNTATIKTANGLIALGNGTIAIRDFLKNTGYNLAGGVTNVAVGVFKIASGDFSEGIDQAGGTLKNAGSNTLNFLVSTAELTGKSAVNILGVITLAEAQLQFTQDEKQFSQDYKDALTSITDGATALVDITALIIKTEVTAAANLGLSKEQQLAALRQANADIKALGAGLDTAAEFAVDTGKLALDVVTVATPTAGLTNKLIKFSATKGEKVLRLTRDQIRKRSEASASKFRLSNQQAREASETAVKELQKKSAALEKNIANAVDNTPPKTSAKPKKPAAPLEPFEPNPAFPEPIKILANDGKTVLKEIKISKKSLGQGASKLALATDDPNIVALVLGKGSKPRTLEQIEELIKREELAQQNLKRVKGDFVTIAKSKIVRLPPPDNRIIKFAQRVPKEEIAEELIKAGKFTDAHIAVLKKAFNELNDAGILVTDPNVGNLAFTRGVNGKLKVSFIDEDGIFHISQLGSTKLDVLSDLSGSLRNVPLDLRNPEHLKIIQAKILVGGKFGSGIDIVAETFSANQTIQQIAALFDNTSIEGVPGSAGSFGKQKNILDSFSDVDKTLDDIIRKDNVEFLAAGKKTAAKTSPKKAAPKKNPKNLPDDISPTIKELAEENRIARVANRQQANSPKNLDEFLKLSDLEKDKLPLEVQRDFQAQEFSLFGFD